MKEYEGHETSRKFLPMLPIYARIDGRGFSKFTKGMNRPFDQRMTDAMIETTKYLVKETHALIGYVQSDEISLAWKAPDHTSQTFFNGKVQKICSVIASMAAAKFAQEIRGWTPYEDRLPAFDARVIHMPVDYEVANMFLWRTMDATKNAVSMATRSHYSSKEMQNQNQAAMLKMLADKDVDFSEFPVAFREGTFVRRRVIERRISPEEMVKLNRLQKGETLTVETIVTRSEIAVLPMPRFSTVANRTEVIFSGAEPIVSA